MSLHRYICAQLAVLAMFATVAPVVVYGEDAVHINTSVESSVSTGGQSSDGASGADGTDGRAGTPGADGHDGHDGLGGAPGSHGASGADGTDGEDGAEGGAHAGVSVTNTVDGNVVSEIATTTTGDGRATVTSTVTLEEAHATSGASHNATEETGASTISARVRALMSELGVIIQNYVFIFF